MSTCFEIPREPPPPHINSGEPGRWLVEFVEEAKLEVIIEVGNGWMSPPRARTPPRGGQTIPKMPENAFAAPYKPFDPFADDETAECVSTSTMNTPPRVTISRSFAALRKKL